MDIKTALAIHNRPWLIEPSMGDILYGMWQDSLNGKSVFNYTDFTKVAHDGNNTAPALNLSLFAKSGFTVAPTTSNQLYNFSGFGSSKIAVINLSGPLMKDDNCGQLGTTSLRSILRLAANAPNVETIIFQIDSPGGQADGTKEFASEIAKVSATKNTVAVITGMMCSAALWIGSACDTIIATDQLNYIGSIGTMGRVTNNTKHLADKGIIEYSYYATASTDKNKIFEDARAGKGEDIIKQYLDPANNLFVAAVQQYRGSKLSTTENVLTGKTYYAEDAKQHGLIDDIIPIDECLTMVMNMTAKNNKKTYNMSNTNTSAAFQSLLIVAAAESFQVVDGGFLLTEEQLNALNVKQEENATVISTLTNANNDLKTKLEATDVVGLQEQLTAALTAKDTAEASVVTANASIEKLKTQLADAQNGAASFFGNTHTDEDDKDAAHADANVDVTKSAAYDDVNKRVGS